jgi:hypothetical protein
MAKRPVRFPKFADFKAICPLKHVFVTHYVKNLTGLALKLELLYSERLAFSHKMNYNPLIMEHNST